MLGATTQGSVASSSSARRKSCVACTRSKRRCDVGLPRCSRCVDKHIDCVYSAPASTRKRRINHCQKGNKTSSDANPIDDATTTTPIEVTSCLDPSDNTAMKDFDFDLVDTSGFMLDTDLVFECPSSLPSFLHDLPRYEDSNKLALAPIPRSFFAFPEDFDTLQTLVNARASYTLEQFRKAPASMVISCSTPWAHYMLYNNEAHGRTMPRSIAIAQACCALDMARCKDNNSVITRNIVARARELCTELSKDDQDTTTSLLDILAATQALLLYHIMLHFNPDPLARDITPLTGRTLESSVRTLHYRTVALSTPYPLGTTRSPRINNDDFICQPALPPPPHPISPDPSPSSSSSSCSSSPPTNPFSPARPPPKQSPLYLPLSPLPQTRAHWHDFILHESSRRTVLMSAIFLVLQEMLDTRHAASPPKPQTCAQEYCLNPWTLSQSLWTASDAVDFAVAWNAGKGVVLDCAGLEHHIPTLDPTQVDTFSKMILTALLGVDETKGWLLAKGGVVL